ncbi:MAG TPA: sulfotransferase domain-containing protein [Acidimicrobiia bacterium]|nr:sulfotransferase domain-containing protein [Acidimicrobiia bacterium]
MVTPASTDAVIAGVNKAGTTSLFVSLSTHPDVAPSAVKETRYFLPARCGQPLEPFATYEAYFSDTRDRPVRLEATPSYLYGGAAVATRMAELLTNPRIIVALREPVSRAISFFTYQKARLRFPADLSFAEYLAAADRLSDDDFLDPENEKYMAVRGGRYADFLSDWFEVFGASGIRIVWFEELVTDPTTVIDPLAGWLGIDAGRFPAGALSSENRTTGFRNKTFQSVALKANDRLERVLRRHPDAKRRLREFYYRLNGRATDDHVPSAVRDELGDRYREPNARLAALLSTQGIRLASWLDGQTPAAGAALDTSSPGEPVDGVRRS